jgi:hypothetical protein
MSAIIPTLVLVLLAVLLIILIVRNFYVSIKEFYKMRQFRQSVKIGSPVSFYHPVHQIFINGKVLKRGVEYAEIQPYEYSRVFLVHINDVYKPI